MSKANVMLAHVESSLRAAGLPIVSLAVVDSRLPQVPNSTFHLWGDKTVMAVWQSKATLACLSALTRLLARPPASTLDEHLDRLTQLPQHELNGVLLSALSHLARQDPGVAAALGYAP